jgi:hypothetical protein
MSQNFVSQVFLETPVIFGDKGLIGDSLLAGIAFRECRDHERAIRELPIDMIDGIPQMSKALCYTAISRRDQQVTFTASIMRDLDHNPAMNDILYKMPPKSARKPDQGPWSNIQSHYKRHHISSLYFLGRGDITAVRRRMNSTSFLGSMISKGYGQIVRVEVREVDSANPWFGMIGAKNDRNVVLRPIPLRFRHLFPDQLDFMTSTETWHNPYFPGHQSAVLESCMVPPFQNGESFAPDDIDSLCHIVRDADA